MLLRTWAVTRKEFIQILRDPRSLVVVILLPIVLLALYGYGINMDIKHLRIGILDQDRTSTSRDFIRDFQLSEYFDVCRFLDSPDDIDKAIESDAVRAVVCIPRKFAGDLAFGKTAKVQVIVDGSDSTTATTALGYISGLIQSYSANVTIEAARKTGAVKVDALQPVDYRPRVLYNPDMESTNYIVPGLIGVILTMLAALLTSTTIVRERERGTIEQLAVSPISPAELMIGKLIPYVLIAFVDVVVITLVGHYVFAVPIRGSTALLMGLSAVFLVAALGFGLLISTIAETQQVALTVAIVAALLPSMLLSGFGFPISNMPGWLQVVTYMVPARYLVTIAKAIFLKGVGISVLWNQALYLAIFAFATLALSAKKFRKQV